MSNLLSDNKGKEKPSTATETAGETEPAESFFDSQLFRILTLGIYLAGVGGLGSLLAIYYLFFFDTRMPDIYLKFPQGVVQHTPATTIRP